MQHNIRIILDTNWWTAFILSKASFGLPVFLFNESITICFSNDLLDEINHTLSYTRLSKRINEANRNLALRSIEQEVTFFEVTSNVSVCRDYKDNFLLALAKDAQADFLITNDEDLLVLNPFENTRILKLTDFITILSAEIDI